MSDDARMTDTLAPAPAAGGAPGTVLQREIARRRTFAIISHPDAGKTTLTEKLLLFGGAIQLAGQVKAKKDKQNTRSDWMAIERARGISVVTSVMTFEYGDAVLNLLDTPGHEDFSDQTYRTLTAVDSAIMVIDAAKGIESRTRKLFEICRLRDIPIVTFINKLDRETREPIELLDEIANILALDTAPMNWPIGRGREFRGTYDLYKPRITRLDDEGVDVTVSGPGDPVFETLLTEEGSVERWRDEVSLVEEACNKFDLEAFRHGTLTPVYFGSALKNFGVRHLLDALVGGRGFMSRMHSALRRFIPRMPRRRRARQRLIQFMRPSAQRFLMQQILEAVQLRQAVASVAAQHQVAGQHHAHGLRVAKHEGADRLRAEQHADRDRHQEGAGQRLEGGCRAVLGLDRPERARPGE